MYHFNCYLPDRHQQMLRTVSDRAEMTYSELIRRMLDYCSQGDVLNKIVPSMSGQWGTELKAS